MWTALAITLVLAAAPGEVWEVGHQHRVASGSLQCSVFKPGFAYAMEETLDGTRELLVVGGGNRHPRFPAYLRIDDGDPQRLEDGFAKSEGWPNDALLQALVSGETLYVEWHEWPSGDIREEAHDLEGFGAAYMECLRVMKWGVPWDLRMIVEGGEFP